MGYRISLYRCPKSEVDEIRGITDEGVQNAIDTLQKDKIKYDTLAHVLDTGNEIDENLCSRLFSNKLEIEYRVEINEPIYRNLGTITATF